MDIVFEYVAGPPVYLSHGPDMMYPFRRQE